MTTPPLSATLWDVDPSQALARGTEVPSSVIIDHDETWTLYTSLSGVAPMSCGACGTALPLGFVHIGGCSEFLAIWP